MIYASVKNGTRPGIGVDEELSRRQGWIQDVSGCFEHGCLWRREEAILITTVIRGTLCCFRRIGGAASGRILRCSLACLDAKGLASLEILFFLCNFLRLGTWGVARLEERKQACERRGRLWSLTLAGFVRAIVVMPPESVEQAESPAGPGTLAFLVLARHTIVFARGISTRQGDRIASPLPRRRIRAFFFVIVVAIRFM